MSEELECLKPEAINNRFLEASAKYTDWFVKQQILQVSKWSEVMHQERINKLSEKYPKKNKAQILAIIKKEDAAWEKKYNSPLEVAKRRIVELERHLEDIKNVILDPNYIENQREP